MGLAAVLSAGREGWPRELNQAAPLSSAPAGSTTKKGASAKGSWSQGVWDKKVNHTGPERAGREEGGENRAASAELSIRLGLPEEQKCVLQSRMRG